MAFQDLEDQIRALQKRVVTIPPVPEASTTEPGVVQLADSAETIAGSSDSLAVTPAGLATLTATEARLGLVELASDAETQAGTDTDRAVTPAGLESKFGQDGIPYRMAAGQVASVSSSFVAVTFPAGRFSVTPHIKTQMLSGAGATVGQTTQVALQSNTGFSVRLGRDGGGAYTAANVDWLAVQMTEGSASG